VVKRSGQTLTSNNPGKQMDTQCEGLEKDYSFTVCNDRTEVTDRSGGMGTIWSPLGDQGGMGYGLCKKVNFKYYSLNTTASHTAITL